MVGNRTFVSTGVTGHQLVAGTRVTLTFRDATLSASAGCNSMSGEYHIVGSTLSVGSLATTEMGCDADRMAQDAWLATFLPGAAFSVGDGLTLTNGTVTVKLAFKEVPNPPLEGTYWVVDGLVSGDAVSSVPASIGAILHVDGGRLELRAGCNRGTGTVTVAAGTLTFGAINLTKKACAPDVMSVERHVTAVLAGTTPFAIDGDTLTIAAAGARGLILKAGTAPVPSDPGPS